MNLLNLLPDNNYLLALHYLCLDVGITGLALLFGHGLIACLQRLLADHTDIELPGGDKAFLALGAGIALMIAEAFLLALGGIFYPYTLLIVFSATGLFSIWILFHGRHKTTLANLTRVDLGVIAWLLILQFTSLSSPTLGDGTSFHLPYADVFIKNHGLAVDYHLIYPFMSLNGSLFYSLALLMEHDVIYAQGLHALFATFTLFGIYRACLLTRQHITVALLAPLLALKLYVIDMGRYTAYVDFIGMFFIFSCVFSLMLWHKSHQQRWLLLFSAMMLGIAMGTKYIMAIFALPVAFYIFRIEKTAAWKNVLIYGGWAALWGLWWYIRNIIYTGNPVHPFAANVFGYFLWDANDMKRQFMGLDLGYVPQNWVGFLLAPVFAFKNPILVEQDIFPVLLALYITAPLLFFAEKTARHLLLFCMFFVFFWVMTTSDPRYLLPAIPLVLVYCGSVAQGLGLRAQKLSFVAAMVTRVDPRRITLLAVSLIVVTGFLDLQGKIIRLSSQAIRHDDAHEQLLRENPTYDLIHHANETFGPAGRVFEFYYRDGRFFTSNILLGTQFGPNAYWRILTAATVERNGVVHYDPDRLRDILVNNYQADGFIIPNPAYFKNHYDQQEFEAVFDLLYQNNDGSIYRIRK